MTTEAPPTRGRGRPRDPELDTRVLEATREVVALVGVRAASMSAIADRAGCGKPSIYLRWPNLRALILAALEDLAPPSGDAQAVFRAASDAMDALAREPHGVFLVEALLLPNAAAFLDAGDE